MEENIFDKSSTYTVAFIGHRNTPETDELKAELKSVIEELIKIGAKTFLFGSNSTFNAISHAVVTELKSAYPDIQRIYVRAQYEHVDDVYLSQLMDKFEDTYFPPTVRNAGYRSYVKRNQEMIDRCDYLIAYYNEGYEPSGKRGSGRSGTKIAVDYARSKKKKIVNLFV